MLLLLLDYIDATTNTKALLISSNNSNNMKIEKKNDDNDNWNSVISYTRTKLQQPRKKAPGEWRRWWTHSGELEQLDAVWAGLLFHSGQQEKETIKLQTHRQETKKRKKREKNLPRVVTNVGDFSLTNPLTTRDLIFCIYFLFVFLLSFWYRGKSRCKRARTVTNVRHTAVDTFATVSINRVKKNQHKRK